MNMSPRSLFATAAIALTITAISAQYHDADASIEICRSEADVTKALTDDKGSVLTRFAHPAAEVLRKYVAMPRSRASKAVAYIAPTGRSITLIFFDGRGCMSYMSHLDLDRWREIAQRADHDLDGEPV